MSITYTTTKIPSTFGGKAFTMSGRSNHMEGAIHNVETVSISGMMGYLKDCSFTGKIGMLFDMPKIDCYNTAFTSPLIVFPSPESVNNVGCKFTGKVVYLSDKSTCQEYGSAEWLASACAKIDHSEI